MRTTPLLATAWAGAAAGAVGLGFFAVSLLDADPVPTASASTVTSAAGTTSAAPTTAAVTTGEQPTEAGTVYGSCADGVPTAGSAPAAGWTVDDSSTGSVVEFKNGDRRLTVTVVCTGGTPSFTVGDGSSSSAATSTSSSAPTSDDSGGHGSDDSGGDDSGGDDSSGHGSGGHGSDD